LKILEKKKLVTLINLLVECQKKIPSTTTTNLRTLCRVLVKEKYILKKLSGGIQGELLDNGRNIIETMFGSILSYFYSLSFVLIFFFLFSRFLRKQ